MQDRSPIMKRCQAVAAHGRRCRQTPYVTSAFCWHHTARADRNGLRNEGQTKVSADRIISVLGAARVAEIANIIETEGPDAIRIERVSNAVATTLGQPAS